MDKKKTWIYKNPWHKPEDRYSGPRLYECQYAPKEYKGYLIFERIYGTCWDVVKDGVCVTQRAGQNGARQYIDKLEVQS